MAGRSLVRTDLSCPFDRLVAGPFPRPESDLYQSSWVPHPVSWTVPNAPPGNGDPQARVCVLDRCPPEWTVVQGVPPLLDFFLRYDRGFDPAPALLLDVPDAAPRQPVRHVDAAIL